MTSEKTFGEMKSGDIKNFLVGSSVLDRYCKEYYTFKSWAQIQQQKLLKQLLENASQN